MRLKILLFALLASICASSQDSVFHISDYKYRTAGYRALALDLNFGGNYNSRSQGSSNYYRTNSTSLGPISGNYYHIRSLEKRFQQSNILFSSNYSSNSNKEGSEKNLTKSTGNSASWNLQTRDYRKNQWFLEWGNEVRGSIESRKMQTNAYHTQVAEYAIQNTATVGFGKGRIEWVQDAQMAVYILQELESQSLLNRTPSTAESNAFAQLITDINNRRVFDSRRRRIYELSRIDSFLKNSGLVTQTDIRHFTTINDNWAFAINPFRRSGSAWFVRIAPGVKFERNQVSDKLAVQPFINQVNHLTFYFTPQIGYEYYRPVSLKWQHNFNIVASYHGSQYYNRLKEIRPSGSAETKLDIYSGSLSLNTSYGVGFFPNSRTQLTGQVGLYTMYENSNALTLQPSVGLSANYFVGYRTYLTGQLSTSYEYSKSTNSNASSESKNYYSSFSVRLTHFLF